MGAIATNVLTDAAIHSVIDSILIHINDAKDRNFARWPVLGQYVWPNYDWQGNTFEDEVDYFENFLFNRLEWMDNNITGLVLQPWVGISAETNKITVKLFGDYFSQPMLKRGDFQLNDAPGGMTILNVGYKNASECVLTVSADATGSPGISITISEKIINTWEDLTSNKLETAGFGDVAATLPEITVFEANQQLHIRCNLPELLPEYAEIVSITGQNLGSVKLEKQTENIVSHQLKAGIYFMVIKTNPKPQVARFVVVN
jgi:hypothetical protein